MPRKRSIWKSWKFLAVVGIFLSVTFLVDSGYYLYRLVNELTDRQDVAVHGLVLMLHVSFAMFFCMLAYVIRRDRK